MSSRDERPPGPLRRAEYDRLVDLGVFENQRVELLDGLIVSKSAPSPRQAAVVTRLNMLVTPAVAGRAEVQMRAPFAASDDSEPEPDLAIIPVGDYVKDHPSKALLVVEVADSSVRKDRLVKLRLYAIARIPEYWIVDLESDVVLVHREPRDAGYANVTRHAGGDNLSVLAFPDIVVPTSTLLPPRRSTRCAVSGSRTPHDGRHSRGSISWRA
jgi:Uma2 family endonuclease